jgi:hypothetical protein
MDAIEGTEGTQFDGGSISPYFLMAPADSPWSDAMPSEPDRRSCEEPGSGVGETVAPQKEKISLQQTLRRASSIEKKDRGDDAAHATRTAVGKGCLVVVSYSQSPSPSLPTALGEPHLSRCYARPHIPLRPRPRQRLHHSAHPHLLRSHNSA